MEKGNYLLFLNNNLKRRAVHVEHDNSSHQCSQNDIDLGASTQVLGKDKRGRTRGVGGKVSRTKLKHNESIVCEMQQVKNGIKNQNEKTDMHCKMNSIYSKMNILIGLMQSQAPRQFSFPTTWTSEMGPTQPTRIPTQDLSSPIIPTRNADVPAYMGKYLIKDITNEKNIAVAKIEGSPLGTTVRSNELQFLEVKVFVECVFPGMENESLHGEGFAKTIGESRRSYVRGLFTYLRRWCNYNDTSYFWTNVGFFHKTC